MNQINLVFLKAQKSPNRTNISVDPDEIKVKGQQIQQHGDFPFENNYCIVPKVLDRQVWANSVDSDRSSSLFCLHLLDSLLYGRATLFKF